MKMASSSSEFLTWLLDSAKELDGLGEQPAVDFLTHLPVAKDEGTPGPDTVNIRLAPPTRAFEIRSQLQTRLAALNIELAAAFDAEFGERLSTARQVALACRVLAERETKRSSSRMAGTITNNLIGLLQIGERVVEVIRRFDALDVFERQSRQFFERIVGEQERWESACAEAYSRTLLDLSSNASTHFAEDPMYGVVLGPEYSAEMEPIRACELWPLPVGALDQAQKYVLLAAVHEAADPKATPRIKPWPEFPNLDRTPYLAAIRFHWLVANLKTSPPADNDLARLNQVVDDVQADLGQNAPFAGAGDLFAHGGISPFDIGLFLEGNDDQAATAWVKRFSDSKQRTAVPIGKCPFNGRSQLYRLSEILPDVERFCRLDAGEKAKLREYLTSRLRRPRSD